MNENIKKYSICYLAKLYGIHTNTIRMYEKIGFITKANRSENNYRVFSKLHLLQLKICRLIFGFPFTNKRIRKCGNEILFAIAKRKWDIGKEYTDCYIKIIKQDISTAQYAARMLRNWANPAIEEMYDTKSELTRKNIAEYLGVSVESVRNWERNCLINASGKGDRGETLYYSNDLGRASVIYMLLQAGYSVASIHRSISMYDKGYGDLVTDELCNPKESELISVGDRWIFELNRILNAAEEIPLIINEMMQIK